MAKKVKQTDETRLASAEELEMTGVADANERMEVVDGQYMDGSTGGETADIPAEAFQDGDYDSVSGDGDTGAEQDDLPAGSAPDAPGIYSGEDAFRQVDEDSGPVQESHDTHAGIMLFEAEGPAAIRTEDGPEPVSQLPDIESPNPEFTPDKTLFEPDSATQIDEPKLSVARPAGQRRRGKPVSQDADTEPASAASSIERAPDPDETASSGPVQGGGDTEPEAPPARRRHPLGTRSRAVLSIGGQRTVQTEADQRRSDLIDMAESLKSGKILTGIVQGVERPEDNPNLSYAVLYHGTIKVVIPAQAMIDMPPEEWEEQSYAYRASMISKRLGAEIDYVVKGVDADNGIAAGSRVEAMAMRRREYIFATDRTGVFLMDADGIAETRVVSVIRAGIFVDFFGLETFIPLNELSYQRWMDAQEHFSPGDRALVRILELARTGRREASVRLSVKQAGEDGFTRAVSRYKTDNNYVGTVSVITPTGIFVNLDGVDCLCRFPKRGRPAVGSRVTVKVLGIDAPAKRIWGVILR